MRVKFIRIKFPIRVIEPAKRNRVHDSSVESPGTGHGPSPSIKLYDINTALHKAFILCICIFLMKYFVVIEIFWKGRHLYMSDPVRTVV